MTWRNLRAANQPELAWRKTCFEWCPQPYSYELSLPAQGNAQLRMGRAEPNSDGERTVNGRLADGAIACGSFKKHQRHRTGWRREPRR